MSRKPSVQTSPTVGPLRWISMFVATVVPCTNSDVSSSRAATRVSSCPASTSSPASMARTGSSAVVSSFHSSTRPSSATIVKSVNVPPMSMPMR